MVRGKTNVLHLLSSSLLGGTETMVSTLIENSSSESINHIYAYFGKRGMITERLRGSGHKVIEFRNGRNGLLWQLHKTIKAENIALLYSYGTRSGIFARIISLAHPSLKIIHGQRSIDANRSLCENLLDWATSGLVDLYISNSQAAADMLIHKGRIPLRKVTTVHNGLDITKFPKASVNEKNPFMRIVCVGNLRKVKGHTYVLHALSILKGLGYQFQADFIGGGSLLEELRMQAESSGIDDCVNFLGVRQDVYDILARSDVFVLGSLWEGLPVSIMEAMACNLPVVASNVGGIPELVIDAQTGYHVPPADPEAIAEKLKVLIEHPEMRKQMGSCGRQRIIDHFSVNEMVRKTEMLIESLCSADK